jgi:AcrR family transcriptional regulator
MIAKTRKKDETRRSILASAQSLFKQKGYEATSVDEIVQAADLVKGTFYYHFDSKEQVLLNLRYLAVIEAVEASVASLNGGATARDALAVLTEKLGGWSQDNPDLARVFYGRSAVLMPQQMQAQAQSTKSLPTSPPLAIKIAEIIKSGQKSGELRQDIDALTLAEHFIFMLFHTQMTWVAQGQKDKITTRLALCLDILIRGIGT